MKNILLSTLFILNAVALFGANQTPTVTSVLPPTSLPFDISIEQTALMVPNGWHSGAVATWEDQCILIAGRTNGLHGFSNDPLVNNFPPSTQNTTVYVINFATQTVSQKSLSDPTSGLTQAQIDSLSVTSPEYYQIGRTLYIAGGYGIDTATGDMETKSTLTALDVPGMISWVINPGPRQTLAQSMLQTSDPIVQVTGGDMVQPELQLKTLLPFGQNFTGLYRDGSNGVYTKQVRGFRIWNDAAGLRIVDTEDQPAEHPAYRRRDLNIVPIILPGEPHQNPSYVALSGVFTTTGGIWTVPVLIDRFGQSTMANPALPATFKQAMNNYVSAAVGLYSRNIDAMYITILGGLTFGYFDGDTFKTDEEIPFTNEVTTIQIDNTHAFSQYIMDGEYPTIPSQGSNPGNTLLFGTGAAFVPASGLPIYRNGVIKFDKLTPGLTTLGYVVGGIQSTVPNTNTNSDSAASPYIFKVMILTE